MSSAAVVTADMSQYIQRKSPGLFDYDNRLEELRQSDPPLYRLDTRIDWEIFRKDIEELVSKEPAGAGGRPRHDKEFVGFSIDLTSNCGRMAG